MKKSLILIMLALPVFALSQSKSIEKFYSKYKGHENITTLTFGGGLIKFAASYDESGNAKVLEKITQVRILVSEKNLISKSEYKSLVKDLRNDSFEDMMIINAEGTKIDFMMREKGNKISDVVMLVNDEEEFIIISLEGNFEYNDLNDINLDIDGAEHLKKLPEKRTSTKKA